MKSAFKEQEIEFAIMEDVPRGHKQYFDVFKEEDCVIFFGSIGMAEIIKRKTKWIPGVYHNEPQYKCSYYYPRLSKFLLNENYMILPYGELLRQKNFLYEHLGNGDMIFIRPNTGSKL